MPFPMIPLLSWIAIVKGNCFWGCEVIGGAVHLDGLIHIHSLDVIDACIMP